MTARTYDGEDLDRRQMLKRAAVGGGLVAAALAAPGLTGVAEAKGGKSINLLVGLDFGTFQAPTSTVPAGDGPFYVGGALFTQHVPNPDPGDSIGVFHCWGFITAPGNARDFISVVNQEFNLDGRGKIQIAGVESNDPRAVTGGTGHFRNARGEGYPDLTRFDDGFFTIDFRLTGAAGPPIR